MVINRFAVFLVNYDQLYSYKLFLEVEFLVINLLLSHFFIKFQEYIVLTFKLKRPYFWAQKVGMLRWSFIEQQISYLCGFLGNVNQSQNMGGTCLLIDLLTKRIFSKVILSPNSKILFSEKNELE